MSKVEETSYEKQGQPLRMNISQSENSMDRGESSKLIEKNDDEIQKEFYGSGSNALNKILQKNAFIILIGQSYFDIRRLHLAQCTGLHYRHKFASIKSYPCYIIKPHYSVCSYLYKTENSLNCFKRVSKKSFRIYVKLFHIGRDWMADL